MMTGAASLDPTAYAAVERLGRSALAWEVLRRNPEYRTAYQRRAANPAFGNSTDPAFVADWGLHFP